MSKKKNTPNNKKELFHNHVIQIEFKGPEISAHVTKYSLPLMI